MEALLILASPKPNLRALYLPLFDIGVTTWPQTWKLNTEQLHTSWSPIAELTWNAGRSARGRHDLLTRLDLWVRNE